MANAIEMIMQRINNTIPVQILHEAFRPDTHFSTLDDRIHEEVIIGRVLSDCNLSSGKPTRIPLRADWAETTTLPPYSGILSTGQYTVYRIPPQARENKRIVACVSLDYPPYLYNNNPMTSMPGNCANSGVSAKDLACTVLNSITGNGTTWRPTPILKNGDLVFIDPPQSAHLDWVLTCRLEFDNQFTNINNDAIFPLVDLVECACKAYVYNKLVLLIDSAKMEGGLEQEKFKEIVESYADQNDHYAELLKEFRGGALLDKERILKLVRIML